MILPEAVRAVPLFANLDDDSVALVCGAAADMHVRQGDWFVYEGEAPAFFVLLDGRFELLKRYASGVRQLAVREPGAYVGEIPCLLGGPFFAGGRCLERSRLLRLEAKDFLHVLARSKGVRDQVVATMLSRIEGLQEEAEAPDSVPIVIGRRSDAACHDVRDFLARNRQPYEWWDPESGRVCDRAGNVPPVEMPVVVLADGTRLVRPSFVRLADALGMRTLPAKAAYDVVIIGGGPAGLAAAVYGASEGLDTVLFDRYATGGQAGTSSRIENYLGFPSGLSGDELAARAQAQAARLGAEIVIARGVLRVEAHADRHRIVYGADVGEAFVDARAVVIATGVSYRTLDVPGIDDYLGAGLYYGASRTEARGTSGRDIVLVGGGNSAGQAAMHFSDYAKSVTILVRDAELKKTMSAYLVDELATKENVSIHTNGEIAAVEGDGRVEFVSIRDLRTMDVITKGFDAIFAFIGADAETSWLPQELVRDEGGYLCTGRDVLDLIGAERPWPHERDPYLLETSIPGIFAAGDVRHGSIKRVASGVGEGSMSIAMIHAYLASSER